MQSVRRRGAHNIKMPRAPLSVLSPNIVHNVVPVAKAVSTPVFQYVRTPSDICSPAYALTTDVPGLFSPEGGVQASLFSPPPADRHTGLTPVLASLSLDEPARYEEVATLSGRVPSFLFTINKLGAVAAALVAAAVLALLIFPASPAAPTPSSISEIGWSHDQAPAPPALHPWTDINSASTGPSFEEGGTLIKLQPEQPLHCEQSSDATPLREAELDGEDLSVPELSSASSDPTPTDAKDAKDATDATDATDAANLALESNHPSGVDRAGTSEPFDASAVGASVRALLLEVVAREHEKVAADSREEEGGLADEQTFVADAAANKVARPVLAAPTESTQQHRRPARKQATRVPAMDHNLFCPAPSASRTASHAAYEASASVVAMEARRRASFERGVRKQAEATAAANSEATLAALFAREGWPRYTGPPRQPTFPRCPASCPLAKPAWVNATEGVEAAAAAEVQRVVSAASLAYTAQQSLLRCPTPRDGARNQDGNASMPRPVRPLLADVPTTESLLPPASTLAPPAYQLWLLEPLASSAPVTAPAPQELAPDATTALTVIAGLNGSAHAVADAAAACPVRLTRSYASRQSILGRCPANHSLIPQRMGHLPNMDHPSSGAIASEISSLSASDALAATSRALASPLPASPLPAYASRPPSHSHASDDTVSTSRALAAPLLPIGALLRPSPSSSFLAARALSLRFVILPEDEWRVASPAGRHASPLPTLQLAWLPTAAPIKSLALVPTPLPHSTPHLQSIGGESTNAHARARGQQTAPTEPSTEGEGLCRPRYGGVGSSTALVALRGPPDARLSLNALKFRVTLSFDIPRAVNLWAVSLWAAPLEAGELAGLDGSRPPASLTNADAPRSVVGTTMVSVVAWDEVDAAGHQNAWLDATLSYLEPLVNDGLSLASEGVSIVHERAVSIVHERSDLARELARDASEELRVSVSQLRAAIWLTYADGHQSVQLVISRLGEAMAEATHIAQGGAIQAGTGAIQAGTGGIQAVRRAQAKLLPAYSAARRSCSRAMSDLELPDLNLHHLSDLYLAAPASGAQPLSITAPPAIIWLTTLLSAALLLIGATWPLLTKQQQQQTQGAKPAEAPSTDASMAGAWGTTLEAQVRMIGETTPTQKPTQAQTPTPTMSASEREARALLESAVDDGLWTLQPAILFDLAMPAARRPKTPAKAPTPATRHTPARTAKTTVNTAKEAVFTAGTAERAARPPAEPTAELAPEPSAAKTPGSALRRSQRQRGQQAAQ